jgi:diacylglycerol kinase (ATP)
MKDPKFSVQGRMKAIGFSVSGLVHAFRTEHAMWFHGCASVLVIMAGLYFQVSSMDWRWLVLGISLVLCAEMMNTAVELICDAVNPQHNPMIGRAKDVAAGAVLAAFLGAAIIDVLVLWPYAVA